MHLTFWQGIGADWGETDAAMQYRAAFPLPMNLRSFGNGWGEFEALFLGELAQQAGFAFQHLILTFSLREKERVALPLGKAKAMFFNPVADLLAARGAFLPSPRGPPASPSRAGQRGTTHRYMWVTRWQPRDRRLADCQSAIQQANSLRHGECAELRPSRFGLPPAWNCPMWNRAASCAAGFGAITLCLSFKAQLP